MPSRCSGPVSSNVRPQKIRAAVAMTFDADQCKAYWDEFAQLLDMNDPRRDKRPDAFAFGGGGELADKLLALVISGTKRATASLPVEYTSTNEPLPVAGDLSIILDAKGSPRAIIERTSVEVIPFQAVDSAFAASEGEGDGSLHYWRKAHAWYFNTVCERLGGSLEPTSEVLCQRFNLIWPPSRE